MKTAGTAGNADKSRVPERVETCYHGNSSDAHNIRDTGAPLATAGTLRLTAEKITATGGATVQHKRQDKRYQGTPELMETPLTEGC
jgi:hypothetical protein